MGNSEVRPVEEESLQFPPVSFLAAMAAAGASLGPVLDGFHSRFGVLQYHHPAPFAVQLGTFELCQTAAWVPPLFGVAGLLIGTLYVLFDQVLDTSPEQLDPSVGAVALNIGLYIAQYFVSELIWGPFGLIGPGQPFISRAAELLIWIWALTQWRVFDSSRAGFLVAVLTAVGGPAIEIGLLNFPGWDLYAYSSPDLLGIPTFILPVYFCGAPAVGCLARYLLKITSGVAPSSSVNRLG